MKKIVLATLAMQFSAFAYSQTQNEKPNILLIMTDDQGWYDIGFNGNPIVKTPNLDALAAQGVIFNRFYSGSSVSSPTRSSCLTGRSPIRNAVPDANVGHLRDGEITIPELLKKEGYSTGHFGKWHLGTLTTKEFDANRGKPGVDKDYSIPSGNGYDTYFCTESKVPTYDPMKKPKHFKEDESLRLGWRAIEPNDSSLYYGTAYWKGVETKSKENLSGNDARVIMDRALPFIDKCVNEQTPFFSTIWIHTPHLPVVADKKHRDIYKELDLNTQLYYGAITAMDEEIGRLIAELKRVGADQNTLIFFCSDNGAEVRTPGSSGPFRGKKRDLYEGGVRVPGFVYWAGHFDQGIKSDFPAVTSDYLPTIVDLLGIEYPDQDRPIDGVSLLPALEEHRVIRPKPIGFKAYGHISWVTNEYKLIGTDDEQNFELYDMLKDPSEENNIAEEHPDVVLKLSKELSKWHQSVLKSEKGEDYK